MSVSLSVSVLVYGEDTNFNSEGLQSHYSSGTSSITLCTNTLPFLILILGGKHSQIHHDKNWNGDSRGHLLKSQDISWHREGSHYDPDLSHLTQGGTWDVKTAYL